MASASARREADQLDPWAQRLVAQLSGERPTASAAPGVQAQLPASAVSAVQDKPRTSSARPGSPPDADQCELYALLNGFLGHPREAAMFARKACLQDGHERRFWWVRRQLQRWRAGVR